jgi:hypothetical protein
MRRNLQPIHPASPHQLPAACCSCGGDVRCDRGFVDLSGPPFQAYYCTHCAEIALGPGRVGRMLAEAHERQLRKTGVLSAQSDGRANT